MLKIPSMMQKYNNSSWPCMKNWVVQIDTPTKQFLIGTYGEKISPLADQYIMPLLLNCSTHNLTAKILLANPVYFSNSARLSDYLGNGADITIYVTPRPIIYQLSQCLRIFSGQMINIQYSEHIIEIGA